MAIGNNLRSLTIDFGFRIFPGRAGILRAALGQGTALLTTTALRYMYELLPLEIGAGGRYSLHGAG
jgi:hypothetical protein